MGTPEFAVPSLQTLFHSNHDIVGVVTVPDKARGRGQKVHPSAVKRKAESLNIPVYQPEDLSDHDFLDQMEALQPDLMVVVAFRILPEECYTIPTHHAINLHASLLPKYRGAAPIQRAIMAGEKQTGVTTFFLKPSVDTGDILLQESISIGSEESAGSVHDRLAELGAEVVLETVDGIEAGSLHPRSQDDDKATPAPKITREDCRIDWARPAEEIHNQVRGLSPYPGAFTYWEEMRLKVFQGTIASDTEITGEIIGEKPGTVVQTDNRVDVSCEEGIYSIQLLQPEGKQRMTATDFLNGYPMEEGDSLE